MESGHIAKMDTNSQSGDLIEGSIAGLDENMIGSVDLNGLDENMIGSVDLNSQDIIDASSSIAAPPEVTYNMLLTKLTELARTIQSDPVEKVKWYSVATKAIKIHRYGSRCVVNVAASQTGGSPQPKNSPLTAVTKSVGNCTKVRRKKSYAEVRRTGGGFRTPGRNKRRGFSEMNCSQNDDNKHLPPKKSSKRNCQLCDMPGHHRFNCPVLTVFGTVIRDTDAGKEYTPRGSA